MRSARRLLLYLATLGIVFPATAAPPPHAPAHGYRHKLPAGVELVFDSGLGVYAVVDFPDHFYYEGKFYRNLGAGWEISVTFGGSWSVTASSAIPVGLHKHKRHGRKGAHPGRGPAKVKKKH